MERYLRKMRETKSTTPIAQNIPCQRVQLQLIIYYILIGKYNILINFVIIIWRGQLGFKCWEHGIAGRQNILSLEYATILAGSSLL